MLFQLRLHVDHKSQHTVLQTQTGRQVHTDKHSQSFCFKINRPDKMFACGPFSKERVSHPQNFVQFSDVGLLRFYQLVHHMSENTETFLYPSCRQMFCLLQLELVSKKPSMLCLLPGYLHFPTLSSCIVQELCESRGGHPGPSVLTSLLVSMDVKIYWTVLWHWSQLVPNMSTDIWGH